MIHQFTIICPECSSSNLVKNGFSHNGIQRWRCNSCGSSFQLDYQNRGKLPQIPQEVEALFKAGYSIRKISLTLEISAYTVKKILENIGK